MTKFYLFETLNDSVIGHFDSREAATAWMTAYIPPEDRNGTPENEAGDYPGSGYRVGDAEAVEEWMEDYEVEKPEAAQARYAECYQEYYPNFTPGVV